MGHGSRTKPSGCLSQLSGWSLPHICFQTPVWETASVRDKYGAAVVLRLDLTYRDGNNPFREGLNAMQFHNLSQEI